MVLAGVGFVAWRGPRILLPPVADLEPAAPERDRVAGVLVAALARVVDRRALQPRAADSTLVAAVARLDPGPGAVSTRARAAARHVLRPLAAALILCNRPAAVPVAPPTKEDGP